MNPRFQRQILVQQFGAEGQKKLGQTTVGIIGVGALGCVVSEQLCRAGVKKLILIDHDVVEEGNLHRQFLYDEKDLGKIKVDVAKKKLQFMNHKVKIEVAATHFSERNCEKLLKDCSIFIDCTDHLETRFVLNAFSRKSNIPWIFGGIAGTSGLVFPVLPEGPCFSCVFERVKKVNDCHGEGILNTTANIVGSMQVIELMKWLRGTVKPVLYVVNGWDHAIDEFNVRKRNDCVGCKGSFKEANIDSLYSIDFCDTKAAYEIKPTKNISLDLHAIKKHFNDIIVETPIVLVMCVEGVEVIVHNYGSILVKECKDKKKINRIAQKLYYYRNK